MNEKDIIKKAILLTDNLAQLDSIIQKLEVLSSDFCYNYLEHFDVSAENNNAKCEIKMIKTMAEVMILWKIYLQIFVIILAIEGI